jgi:hypothetical protein
LFVCVFVKHIVHMIFLFLNVITQNKKQTETIGKLRLLFLKKIDVNNDRLRSNLKLEAWGYCFYSILIQEIYHITDRAINIILFFFDK